MSGASPAPEDDGGAQDSGSTVMDALRKVAAGPRRKKDLTLEEARAAADSILSGAATPSQIGALLIALRVKEERAEELAGFTLALRQYCVPPPALPRPLIDTAGAYDGRVRTLPVGAAASLVCTRVGLNFLLHGLRGLGRAGVAPRDLLTSLEINTGLNPAARTVGSITYLDQAEYCPALARLLPLRNELGLRTAFNTAEKLVGLGRGKVGETALLVGVFHGGYLATAAEAVRLTGFQRALIVQGLEGSEDLNATRDSRVCEFREGQLSEWLVNLEEIGITPAPAAALACTSAQEAANRLQPALRGDPGPVTEALVLNIAARLYLGGRAASLKGAVPLARQILTAGR